MVKFFAMIITGAQSITPKLLWSVPCFCYSVAFNLSMQSGVVSESVVLNNFCVYDSDENVYEFEVSI